MAVVNDGVRFLLELCVLASMGYWGFTTADGLIRWALGIGAPLLARGDVGSIRVSPGVGRDR